jgi:hypothetical protein
MYGATNSSQSELQRGVQGQQIMGTLNNAVASSEGLSSQKDAIMYRAVMATLPKGSSMFDVMKAEQGGMTPEILSSLKSQIAGYTGGNKSDEMMMFMQSTGLNAAQAENVWGLKGTISKDAIAAAEKAGQPTVMGLPEAGFQASLNQIMKTLTDWSAANAAADEAFINLFGGHGVTFTPPNIDLGPGPHSTTGGRSTFTGGVDSGGHPIGPTKDDLAAAANSDLAKAAKKIQDAADAFKQQALAKSVNTKHLTARNLQ